MWVRPPFRRRGPGRATHERLVEHTLSQGIDVLRLETGVDQTAAIALDQGLGFPRIPPFPPYRDDPLSLCYETSLR